MDGGTARFVSPGPLSEAIRQMLPVSVAVRAVGAGDLEPGGFLDHPPDISDPTRLDQFRRGRVCALRALDDLELAGTIVGRGSQREPLWPDGFVGSITHVADLSAAAVAPSTVLRAIGIDAEPNDPLPAGVEEFVVTDGAELAGTRRWQSSAVNWPTVLFSAKESVYKAWYPVVGNWLDFQDVRVVLSPVGPTTGEFSVGSSGSRPMSSAQSQLLSELSGCYHVDPGGLVITTAVLAVDTAG